MAYNANGLYPHKAPTPNEFNSSTVSDIGILACHEDNFEDIPDAFDMHPLTDRANSFEAVIIFSLYGRLALPNTKVRNKVIRASPNFYMPSDNPNFSLKIVDCLLNY